MIDQSEHFVDDAGITHKLSPLRFETGGVLCQSTHDPHTGRTVEAAEGVDLILQDDGNIRAERSDDRMDRLEAMVKRIAAHLGIE